MFHIHPPATEWHSVRANITACAGGQGEVIWHTLAMDTVYSEGEGLLSVIVLLPRAKNSLFKMHCFNRISQSGNTPEVSG